jgi:hypothetical protein
MAMLSRQHSGPFTMTASCVLGRPRAARSTEGGVLGARMEHEPAEYGTMPGAPGTWRPGALPAGADPRVRRHDDTVDEAGKKANERKAPGRLVEGATVQGRKHATARSPATSNQPTTSHLHRKIDRLTKRGPTSPAPRSATTSSSTTWKPSPWRLSAEQLTPTGTLIPNSGRGGRWLGPIGRIVKACVLSGFTRQQLRPFVSGEKRQDLLTLADLLTTGQVTPVIDRTYPLDEAADALGYVAAGHTRGKVVVTV